MDALALARALRQAAEDSPVDVIDWTEPQLAWLRCTPKTGRKLLRAGNQVGKTTAGLAEVIWQCTETHPYRTPRLRPSMLPSGTPFICWILCSKWKQSVAVMRKFHALLPKRYIKRGKFNHKDGYGVNNPTVELTSGALIRFVTIGQNIDALASETVHLVLIDEPCPQSVHDEIERRTTKTGGDILYTLTPINHPVEYLREMVEAGGVEEVHARFVEASFRHAVSGRVMRTASGEVCDAAWIAKQRALMAGPDAPIRLDGEWERRSTGAYFSHFVRYSHVHDRLPEHDYRLTLGIDHGAKPGKQIAVLVASWREGDEWGVYVVDEYTDSTGYGRPVDDARGILAMLGRWSLKWGDLHSAWGDRVHMPGTASQKSNHDLSRELRILLRTQELRPPIWTAKRGEAQRGAVEYGARWLHGQMSVPGLFGVHPRCSRLVEALEKYDGRDNDWKDPVDALRYAIKHILSDYATQTRSVTLRVG